MFCYNNTNHYKIMCIILSVEIVGSIISCYFLWILFSIVHYIFNMYIIFLSSFIFSLIFLIYFYYLLNKSLHFLNFDSSCNYLGLKKIILLQLCLITFFLIQNSWFEFVLNEIFRIIFDWLKIFKNRLLSN